MVDNHWKWSITGWIMDLPSGKHTKNYGKIHHFQWENSLFLWPFSIAMLVYQRLFSVGVNLKMRWFFDKSCSDFFLAKKKHIFYFRDWNGKKNHRRYPFRNWRISAQIMGVFWHGWWPNGNRVIFIPFPRSYHHHNETTNMTETSFLNMELVHHTYLLCSVSRTLYLNPIKIGMGITW